jgi:hypothetical protein
MDKLVRNGVRQTWLPVNSTLHQFRVISDIQNSTIFFDVPTTDAVNAVRYRVVAIDPSECAAQTVGDNGHLSSYQLPGLTTEVGIENIWIIATPDESGFSITDPRGRGRAIVFLGGTQDSWLRNMVISGYNGGITINTLAAQITVARTSFRRGLPTDSSAGGSADISLSAQQVLVVNCDTANLNGSSSFETTTMSDTPGPNVCLNHRSDGPVLSQPHMRWATGFLLGA